MNYSIDTLMQAVEKWLVTGELNTNILSSDFTFSSPFWKKANKQEFIAKFSDPTEYIEKSLVNITKFDPIVYCASKDGQYFTLTLTYHTKNGCSVDEVVLCEVNEGLLQRMKTIYDLSETKKAHNM